jgi:hypothetical protein
MKTKSLVISAAILSMAIIIFTVRQITPDPCWPSGSMLFFISVTTIVAMSSIAGFIWSLQKIRKIGPVIQVLLHLFSVFLISGFAIALSTNALVNLGQQLNGSDAVCFSSLGSNYLNRYVEIFWILTCSGILLAVSVFFVRVRKLGSG